VTRVIGIVDTEVPSWLTTGLDANDGPVSNGPVRPMVGVMGNRSFRGGRSADAVTNEEMADTNEWTYPEAWTALMEVSIMAFC
jgi:hypothetical protein